MEVLKSHKAGLGGSFLAAKKSEFDMRLRGVAYVPYCTFFLFSNLIDTSCISLTVIYVFGGFDVSWMPDGISVTVAEQASGPSHLPPTA